MQKITFNLITDDQKNDEFVVYLVECGPWKDKLEERLKELQARLYDTFDVIVDGNLASKYPESVGRQIRIQVDSHNSPPVEVLDLVRKFNAFIRDNGEYQQAIERSAFVKSVRAVNGIDIRPRGRSE